MAQSYKIRLQGKEQKVKDDCKMYGYGSTKVMDKYQAHGWLAWEKYIMWLFDGILPPFLTEVSQSNYDELRYRIGDAVLHILDEQKAEIARLKAEIVSQHQELEVKEQRARLEAVGCLNLLENYTGEQGR